MSLLLASRIPGHTLLKAGMPRRLAVADRVAFDALLRTSVAIHELSSSLCVAGAWGFYCDPEVPRPRRSRADRSRRLVHAGRSSGLRSRSFPSRRTGLTVGWVASASRDSRVGEL